MHVLVPKLTPLGVFTLTSRSRFISKYVEIEAVIDSVGVFAMVVSLVTFLHHLEAFQDRKLMNTTIRLR